MTAASAVSVSPSTTPASVTTDSWARVSSAVHKAVSWSHAQQKPDGHWCAELESNCSITAEYVLMRQALGLELGQKQAGLVQYLSEHQNEDGSWSIAHDVPGDVSTSAECYLALRILGLPVDDPRLKRAQGFILAHGGLEKVRVFTRVHLALFGLVPWHVVPSLPPELVLLPASSPINIYSFASWARGTIVPLLVLFHHQPVFALPNGQSANNSWLDLLWRDAAMHKQLLETRSRVHDDLAAARPGLESDVRRRRRRAAPVSEAARLAV